MAHFWLHHEMSADQLAHHFGTFDSKLVDPNTYQVAFSSVFSKYKRKQYDFDLHLNQAITF